MSTESRSSERVRAAILSLLLVLSVVGGATAIAGQSVADGSLTDDVDDTLNDTEDELDSETTTETATPTPTPTTDDSGSDDGDELTDGVEDTDDVEDTANDVEDTSDDGTDSVEETTDVVADTADGAVSDSGGLETTGLATSLAGFEALWGLAGTQSTTGDSTDSTDSGASAGAEPDEVGITAGAENQAPIATAGAGPATLNFTETEAGAFPENGTAELSLAEGTDVAFDVENTSASATGDNASVTVTNVSASTVTLAVASTDANATSTIHLQGLRFVSAGDATTTDVTWSFGNATGATTVTPERLSVIGFGDDVARGASGVPEDDAAFALQAPSDATTEGFVEEGETISIRIPGGMRNDIEFDTSATLDITSEGGDCGLPLLGDPRQEDYFLTSKQIIIEVSCEIGSEEYIYAEGIRFNVSGADASTPAEVSAQMTTVYKPVDRIELVDVDAGESVDAHAPPVETTTTTVQANTSNTTGDGAVSVSVTDDVGNLIGDGTRMTLELEDTGVTFNDSQTFEAVTISGDTPAPTVVSANGTTVVLEANGPTEAGDEFRIQRADGEAIRFDVGANASDAALYVSTSPGGEDVTQAMETVISVGPACHGINQAIAGDDGTISNMEIAAAVDHWQDGTEVDGTCGRTISNRKIAELKDIWRTGETVSNS